MGLSALQNYRQRMVEPVVSTAVGIGSALSPEKTRLSSDLCAQSPQVGERLLRDL
jgi:hypothetical protein